MADRNPYVIGVPLTESAAFYGRQDFFKFIKDVLDAAKQNVIVLYGQRRIGKTSVLHRAARWLEEQGSFFPVYYDLQGKERLSLGEVLENLAQTLARRLELPRPDPERFDDDGRYFGDEFLSQAFKRLGKTRLVLLMDEFDVLSDELESARAASKTLFPYLQNLIVTRPQIGYVFVVGRRIEELATHFQAIFKQAVYRRVGHLKPDESRELIVEPARGMVTYADDAVRAIQDLAAGHPYFTQLICFEAFNAVKDGDRIVTAEVVDVAVSRAIESGHGALNWFWEGLPRPERFTLSAVAQASSPKGVASKEAVRHLLEEHRIALTSLELKDAPDRLVEWEMLSREGPDAYRFVVEIVRRWVVAEHPLSSARRDIDYVSKRAVRLFENARDAHSEGDLPYARDEYRRTLKANPNHSGAQLGLALVLFELGEIDEAIVEFQHAYAIDEMSARDGLVRARLAKAKALEEQKQLDDAVAQYEQVLQLVPAEETSTGRLGAIWQLRADAALAAGNLTAATNAYRSVLRYDDRQETLERMQKSLLAHAAKQAAAGEFGVTIETYALLAKFAADPKTVRDSAVAFGSRFGERLQASGRTEEAAALYGKLTMLFPGDAQLEAGFGAARARAEEQRNVNRIFEAALNAHRAGDLERARGAFKKLIQMDVLSYRGENIASLLADTVTKSQTPPETDDGAGQSRVDRPRVAAASAPQRQEEAPPPEPWRRTAVIIVGGLFVIGYLSMPASVTRISLPRASTINVGETLQLHPLPEYSAAWRGRPPAPARSDYFWESSNDSIAKVSDGNVIGVAAGTAHILAAYGGVTGSTDVEVTEWVIPPMKATLVALRFFRGVPSNGKRVYETKFAASDQGRIYSELELDLPETETKRALEARLMCLVTHSDGSLAGAHYTVDVEAQPSWSGVVNTIKLNFDTRPDTYTVTYYYGSVTIATATLVVD